MKRFIRWVLFLILLTGGLILAAIWMVYTNRDTLLEKVVAELNTNINGTLSVEKINFSFVQEFPSISVILDNVTVRDEHYDKFPVDVVHASSIVAELDLVPLLRKEIVIQGISVNDGNIFICKGKNGEKNTGVFHVEKKDSVQSPKVDLSHIAFDNVLIRFADSTKNKFFQVRFLNTEQTIERPDSSLIIRIRGDVLVDSLYFNPKSGSYIKNKELQVDLALQPEKSFKRINILNSWVEFDKNRLLITGSLGTHPNEKYYLNFEGKNLALKETTALLNTKLRTKLSKFSVKGTFDVIVNLDGRSLPGSVPNVDVAFSTKKANLRYKHLDFAGVNLTGEFTNHVDSTKVKDNKNSRIQIKSFEGKMEKIPVTGSVSFVRLNDPYMVLSFKSKASYRDLNDHLDHSRFRLDKGSFETTVSYSGKVSEYMDSERSSYKGKLKGSLKATNVSFEYKPKKILVNEMQLDVQFDQTKVVIENLKTRINESPVSIQGEMRNFIPFFITPQHKAYVNLKVTSPDFDMTTLAERRTQLKSINIKQQRKKLSDLLDMVYHRLHFDVEAKADKIKFRKFSADHFHGKLTLNKEHLRATPISMKFADGEMNLDFSLEDIFQPSSRMFITAKLNQTNIRKVFENFNNFSQRTIGAENLEGNISADVTFSAHLDEAFTVLPQTMQGHLSCVISEGALKNFVPMEQMSNFLFKKRDFSDIRFATLHSTFTVNGTQMDIDRMEIQSSVLTLFLEGRYSFTDSTSLSVQLPLSNLKRRHRNFKPKNVGVDAKVGPSVFLHVYRDKDINSKIKIDYDPFKKWAAN